jgi:hypothetical protein
MRIWFILLLVFVISCSPKTLLPAQSNNHKVDQADKIILEVNDRPKENYQNILRYLSEEGFRLHFFDYSSLNIQTAYEPFEVRGEGVNNYIRINVSVMDTTIHFSGQVSGGSVEEGEIKKVDKKDDLYQKAWQKMLEIAEGYPHEQMYFSRN